MASTTFRTWKKREESLSKLCRKGRKEKSITNPVGKQRSNVAKLTIKPMTTYQAPRCRFCDQEVARVLEREESIFRFNEAGGFYEADLRADFIQAKCLTCDTDVTQQFDDGVCNYQAPKAEQLQPIYRVPNYGMEEPGQAPALP
jgi:hypothetical protein